MHIARPACLLLLVSVLGLHSATAQTQRSGGGASAQVMQQYQQMFAERNQLQADNAKLKADLDGLKKQLDAANKQIKELKSGVGRTQATVAAAQAASAASAKSVEEYKAKMQELVGRFRETIGTLHTAETERAQLRQQLAERDAAFDRCATHNYDLYEVNREVLDHWEHQGTFSCLARDEPFTRLKRTQIENQVDEYRQRAEQLRVKQAALSQQGAAPSQQGAAQPPAPAAKAPPAP